MVKRDLFEEEAFQQTFNELREHVCNEMKVFKVKDSENKANDEAYAWCVWEKLEGQYDLERGRVGVSEAGGVAQGSDLHQYVLGRSQVFFL